MQNQKQPCPLVVDGATRCQSVRLILDTDNTSQILITNYPFMPYDKFGRVRFSAEIHVSCDKNKAELIGHAKQSMYFYVLLVVLCIAEILILCRQRWKTNSQPSDREYGTLQDSNGPTTSGRPKSPVVAGPTMGSR